MKGNIILKRLLLADMLLCLLTGNTVYAASKPSQAGDKVLSGGQRDFKWPVPGEYNLSSCFLDYRRHYAIDIAAPMRTAVVASYAGTVVKTFSGCSHNYGKDYNCCNGFGNYVIMKHNYTLKSGENITLYTQYAHLTAVSVSVGQQVSKGSKVGTIGSTGHSTGPHLDFQILTSGYGSSYTSFRNYSIDPYVNDLLELPEALHTTFGSCCRAYVSYVKDLYPRCTHESFNAQGKCAGCGYNYDWKSTKSTTAMGNYRADSATTPKTIPYSAASNAGQTLTAGSTVSVSASYTNGAAQQWYAVTVNGTVIGYVPKSALTLVSYFDSQYDGKITAPANGQTLKKQSYTVKGSISSAYPLRKVSGYLDGKRYGTWSSSGSTTKLDLTGTDINNKLYFSSLAPGKHTLRITATDATGRGETTVAECTFYVEAPPKYYTLAFEPGEQVNPIESTKIMEGKTPSSLPAPQREGYLLGGWFTAAEGGTQITTETTITENLTLYARWIPLEHTVTIGDTQLTVLHEQTIPQFPAITKTGYRLIGWYTEAEGGIQITEETAITQDRQLYPQWAPMTYLVTLDPGEGTLLWDTKTVTYQDYYGALPAPHREGYIFAGWQLDGSPIANTTVVATTGNHTLTATWSAVSTASSLEITNLFWFIPVGLAVLGGGSLALILYRKKKKAEETPLESEIADIPQETEEPEEAEAIPQE